MADSQINIVVSTPGAADAARQLEQLGNTGSTAFGQVHGAAKQAAEGGLAAVEKASELVHDKIRDLGGELGSVGQVLMALGPAGLAAGAALGVFTAGLVESTKAAAEAELAHIKIAAVLKATEGASGQTAEGIERLAESMATTTLATKEGVEAAAAQLATFRSIGGETFTEILKLAEDLATTGFGDLGSNAVKLARMIEDPIHNLDDMKRAGVEFDPVIKEQIKNFAEFGNKAAATALIIDQLTGKFGGVGEGAGHTLIGSVHALGQEFLIGWENIGKYSAAVGSLKTMIEDLSQAYGRFMAVTTPQGQLDDYEKKLADAQKRAADPSILKFYQDRIDAIKNIMAVMKAAADTEELNAQQRQKHAEDAAAADTLEQGSKDLLSDALARLQKSNDDYFAAQDKEKDKRDALIAQLDTQRDKEQRMALAVTEGGAAVDKLNLQLEIEANLRKLGTDASPEEIQAVIDKTTAIHDATNSVRDYNQSVSDQQKADDAAAAAAAAAAAKILHEQEQQARAIAQFAQQGSDAVVQSIVAMAEGAKHPLDAFKNYVIKAFEQIAAASFIRPIIEPMFVSAAGTVLGSTGAAAAGGGYGGVEAGAGSAALFAGYGSSIANSINTFGANYLGTAVGPDAIAEGGVSLTSIMGGAGLGAIGGNLITGLYGGNRTVGSIGGAVTGALLASGQIELAAIAAAVTVLGSLFGPKMSNNTGVSNLDLATGAYSSGAGDPRKVDQANISAAGQLSSTVEQFVQFLTGEAGQGVQGRTYFEVGSRDGITANVAGVGATFSNDDSGAAQAIGFAVKQVAAQLGSSLPAEIKDALDHVDFSSTQSVQAALAQLQTVKSFVDLEKQIANIGKPADSTADSWNTTIAQISALAETVKGLGVDAGEADGLVDKFKESFRAAYLTQKQSELYDASGEGFLNTLQGAIDEHKTALGDDSLMGISTSTDDKIFAAKIKSALGSLSADQLAIVQQIFGEVPEIADAVKAASDALSGSADAQQKAADAATAAAAAQQAQSDALAYINNLYATQIKAVGDQISTLNAAAGAWGKIADSLQAFGSGLLIDPSLSPLGLGEQVDQARAQMQGLFKAGMGGDQNAATQFQAVAKQFLTLDKQFNASDSTYGSDFQMVEDMSSRLQAYAGSQVSVAQQQLDVLNQILGVLQTGQAAATGKTGASTAGNNPAYGATITSAYGAALKASGMSEADFLNSPAGAQWITARNELVASTTDPTILANDLQSARTQAGQPGMASIGGGYVAAVIAQMAKQGIPVPAFAEGGIATRPTLAYVAEAGSAEAMIPLKGGSVPVSLGSIGPKLDRLAAAVEDLAAASSEGHGRTIDALRLIVDNTRDAASAPIRAAQLGFTSARRRALGSQP